MQNKDKTKQNQVTGLDRHNLKTMAAWKVWKEENIMVSFIKWPV